MRSEKLETLQSNENFYEGQETYGLYWQQKFPQ